MHRPRVFERDEEEEHPRREYDLEVWYRYEPPGIRSLVAFLSRGETREIAILLIKAHVLFCEFRGGDCIFLDIVSHRIILYIILFDRIFFYRSILQNVNYIMAIFRIF